MPLGKDMNQTVLPQMWVKQTGSLRQPVKKENWIQISFTRLTLYHMLLIVEEFSK